MAMAIGLQCTACEQCASICPGGAIRHGLRRPWIDPLVLTERLPLASEPQCALRCPMDAIAPASARPRSPAARGAPSVRRILAKTIRRFRRHCGMKTT